MNSVRIITFNIAHGRGLGFYQGFTSLGRLTRNLEGIGNLLARNGADIVAMQEVDENSAWNRRVNLLDEIGKVSGLEHRVMGVHTRRTGRFHLNYGNAVLSRFEVRSHHNQAFGSRRIGEKGFLYAEIDVGGAHPVPVLNLHLDFRSRSRRLEQVGRIVEFFEGPVYQLSPLPPIVCGDFNVASHRSLDATAELYRYLHNRHGYKMLPEGTARTFPSQWPRRTIDFIFVPEAFKIIRSEVIRCYLSDHCPVMVELQLPDEVR